MILSDDSQIGVEIEDPFGDDDADIDLNVVLREIDEQVRPCTPTAGYTPHTPTMQLTQWSTLTPLRGHVIRSSPTCSQWSTLSVWVEKQRCVPWALACCSDRGMCLLRARGRPRSSSRTRRTPRCTISSPAPRCASAHVRVHTCAHTAAKPSFATCRERNCSPAHLLTLSGAGAATRRAALCPSPRSNRRA